MLSQRVEGSMTRGRTTPKPKDSPKKAELMAVYMRRSRKRDLIASKSALRSPHATKEQPVC